MRTEFTPDGLMINAQDLSAISPKSEDHDRMFHHDGSSSINMVGGSSTTQRGYYVWDQDVGAWYALFHNADKLDGKESGAFLHRDGSLAMEGDLDLGHFGLLNTDSVESGVGRLLLNNNHAIFEASSGGSSVRLRDNDGLLLLDAVEGGAVNIPNGELAEQGDRVATRTWTNNNADVANADYADDANTLDGLESDAFLQVSGDQMEGVLDLGGFDLKDGGTVKYDTSTGNFPQSALGGPAGSLSAYPLANTDVANSAVTVTAGNQLSGGGTMSLGGSVTLNLDQGAGSDLNADTLDGYQGSDFAALAENETVGGTWTFSNTPSIPAGSYGDEELDFKSTSFSTPVTKWANGISDEEIWRTELQAGETLEVHRLEIQPKGGGDVANLDVDVYDLSTSTVIASTSDVVSGSPASSSSDGANVIVRVSNGSGSYQNASVNGVLCVV